MTDDYRESAEFLDLMSQQMWQALRAPVTAAMRDADPAAGPIVDLGAGSGLGVLAVAAAVPGAEIIAVEPSSGQRAALLARVAADADLRDRVTVLAATAQDAALPSRAAAVLALNMAGHLAPAERHALWAATARTLPPGAPLLTNAQPPETATAVPETVFAEIPVGRHRYEGAGRAEPSGPDRLVWHMRYRVRDADGALLREVATSYPWHVVSAAALAGELRAAGFTAEADTGGLIHAVRTPAG
ncbi:methyltransferase domain-containing protein [Catenuloplanes indicus]|uniref:Precorrin-6B methylase 2 n=1 Tax=Catenuloplanes indicus TaxID=137267 RepID=A0AAE3VV10_9ACTN|nr:class I SAM-dependent methyltransferase [Catenuloplanes indicus]MDQ0363535.1 precorrin-6B methylase 2 [Catenuloplanes indicus]